MLSKRKKFDNRIQMVDTNTIAISVPYWDICKPNSGRIQHLIDLTPLPPLPIAHLILTHSLLYIICIHHPFQILNVDINKKFMDIVHEILDVVCREYTLTNVREQLLPVPFLFPPPKMSLDKLNLYLIT